MRRKSGSGNSNCQQGNATVSDCAKRKSLAPQFAAAVRNYDREGVARLQTAESRLGDENEKIMTRLPINIVGYIFQKGLDDIRRAYDTTITVLEENRAKRASDLSDFERALSAGEMDAWEYDEDGEELYRRESLYQLLIEEALSEIAVAREAYVVILHHYWEKRCKEWMQLKKRQNYIACEAYEHLQALGLAVDQLSLETLRLTCNEIKHGNEAPNLSANDVDRMFEAVKTSGIQSEWSQGDLDLP